MNEYEYDEYEYEEEEEKNYNFSRAAIRRKNEWKYAKRRIQLAEHIECNNDRPIHYYAKNSIYNGYAIPPCKTRNKGNRRYISKNYNKNINWSENDKRKIDSLKSQMEELYE